MYVYEMYVARGASYKHCHSNYFLVFAFKALILILFNKSDSNASF